MLDREKDPTDMPVGTEDLSAFADGALPQRRARVVASHLRRHRQSAETVYQYWCQDADLFAGFSTAELPGGLSGDDGTENLEGEAQYAQPRSNPGFFNLRHGLVAGALLASGILIGAVMGFYPASGDEQSVLVDTAVLPVPEQPVATLMVSETGKAMPQVQPQVVQRERGIVESPASIAALSSKSVGGLPAAGSSLPEPNVLPKSQLPLSQTHTFHFIGADGAHLTLVKSGAGVGNDEGQWQDSVTAAGAVQWVQAGSLMTLTGNLDTAGMLLVAMELQARQTSLDPVGASDARLQTLPATPADRRAAPGTSTATADILGNL